MGIDAVALLRIPKLAAPPSAHGAEYLVWHRGKASLLCTCNRFAGTAADEHALALRQLLGPALDAHHDPRGILFFPDVCEPQGRSYDAIVREVESAGVWAPKVELDHVPTRYAHAPTDTHDALVAELVNELGRDRAAELDLTAQVQVLLLASSNGRADAARAYRAALADIASVLGEEFARSYDLSLRGKVEALHAAHDAHFAPAPRDKKKKR